MAIELSHVFEASATALAAGVLLDVVLGDPTYRAHPIRLMGASLAAFERALRAVGADGRAGGILLFVFLAVLWIPLLAGAPLAVGGLAAWTGWILHVFILYSLLALGDLLRHVWRVERALSRDDLDGARIAISFLVGRDVDRMDAAACRRASIESLSESLTDGFTSALFWYAIGGLAGLVLFKIASTMDSMVGYRTPRYLYFGWWGARADDVMNYVPARLTWLVIVVTSVFVPGASARKALIVGLRQHAVLPGPNAGWSESASAGAIQRRLVGPIWRGGVMVTDLWLGDPSDPPASGRADLVRAMWVVTLSGLIAAAMAAVVVLSWR